MAFLGVLVVASLFIVSPVLSKKEKSYTAESCNERCHKKHGYIIIPLTGGEETTEWMTTGSLVEKEEKPTSKFLKRVTLKKPTPKKSTLICDCKINPYVLDHIEDKGLILEDFLGWFKKAPWMGRGWLRIKGIKVKFPENSKYNKDQKYPVEGNQDLPPFDSPFQLDHHSQSFSHHSADQPFFQLDLTKFQKSLPRDKMLNLEDDLSEGGKTMVENKFFKDLKHNMDPSTPVKGNQDLPSSRVENSRSQPLVNDIKSIRSASRGSQDELSPPEKIAHHLQVQYDRSPPRNMKIDLQHSHSPPRDGKSVLHHATAGHLKSSDALLDSEKFLLHYIPTEQSTVECSAKCQVRGGYVRGEAKDLYSREGGAKHRDKIDLLVGMINDTEKVETCVCRLNFVLIQMVKSKDFDAEDVQKFEDLQDKPLVSVIHWLRKHGIEVHTHKTPFFKQFLRTNSMRGSEVQNPKTPQR
ncbi:unnamed protein product [Bemisia tabaci]|uniref:Uncharacterized protein n=1 Tax=Bemisia tabaci TaxID=7038 RepID=A0A9P0AIS5_BEMTA|nr:unnamed protein product [Bemisia tabaci]